MIGRGVLGDEVAMGQILSDWIEETAWMPKLHSRMENEGFCKRLLKTTNVITAKRHSKLVGFLALEPDEIPALYLAIPARGQGIGTELLSTAKREASALTLWTFQANTGAQKFYTREGFTEIQRTDGASNDEKLPDIQYRWSR